MKILWFAWKDQTHPQAGGAEVVKEELVRRLANDGHEVIVICGAYDGCKPEETIDGCRIIRVGNRYSVYWQAYRYYKKNLKGWADFVIEEVNTIPFMTQWYAKERRILLIHQLCREIWFYELPKYIGWIGWLLEPMYLRLLSKNKVITVSQSTKSDLLQYGFHDDSISIISEGIHIEPIRSLESVKKYDKPTILIHGSIRSMKRPLEAIKAFEIAKQSIPDLQLKISGGASGAYGKQVLDYANKSIYKDDIEYLGRTTDEEKAMYMQRCHVILVTSIREGWGLIVSEANSQGTPAVVYDVPGLRDSVRDGETGIVTEPSYEAMASGIVELLRDDRRYADMRLAAYNWSKTITFEKSYNDFVKALSL